MMILRSEESIGAGFGGRVVGSTMGRELRHARTMDAKFLIEEGNFLLGTVAFGLQSHTGVGAIGCPATGVSQNELGQADHLQDRRLDMRGPASG